VKISVILSWLQIIWIGTQALVFVVGALYAAVTWRRPPADPDEDARLIFRS